MSALANIIAPIFALVLCGYLAGRSKILGDASAGALNKFVYFFALPALLFLFTARAPVADILNWGFIAAFLLGSIATFVAAMLIARFVFGHEQPTLGLFALTSVFSNTAYLGIPLFLTAFGPSQAGPAIVATVSANTIFIGGTIALFEASRSSGRGIIEATFGIVKRLARNPLVVSPVIALPLTLSGAELPSPLIRFLELLGSTAGPAALFALGLSFVERRVQAKPTEISVLLALKLLIHPAVTWLIVYWVFDLDPFWAASAVLLAALPTGALAFVMAEERGKYVAEVSTVTVVSTALSIITISAILVFSPALSGLEALK